MVMMVVVGDDDGGDNDGDINIKCGDMVWW